MPENASPDDTPLKLERVIIFSGKKQRVKEVSRSLKQMKINCGEMHSDLSQAERDNIMFKFKSGEIGVLVATDIVARGIDIDDIAMVINYDVPHDVEDYVHRIGRTARAARDGVAITFVSDDEIYLFKKIENFLEKDVLKNPLPQEIGEAPDYNSTNKKKEWKSDTKKNSDRRRHSNKKGKSYNNTHNNNKKKSTNNDRKSERVRTPKKGFSHDSKR